MARSRIPSVLRGGRRMMSASPLRRGPSALPSSSRVGSRSSSNGALGTRTRSCFGCERTSRRRCR
eukprot:8174884-Alexandrium_andersonii.AAC.1